MVRKNAVISAVIDSAEQAITKPANKKKENQHVVARNICIFLLYPTGYIYGLSGSLEA
jgi:hypothetical protein